MYYVDLPIFVQIIWLIFGALVLLPWIAIPAIAVYKLFQVKRMPRTSAVNGTISLDPALGFTMADGGESVEKKNKK